MARYTGHSSSKIKYGILLFVVFIGVSYYFTDMMPSFQSRIKESADELFIYHQVIHRLHDKFNQNELTQLRVNTLSYREMADSRRYFVLTQDNSNPGMPISYYLKSFPMSTTLDEKMWTALPQKSPFDDKHYKRCSLVGNGGIILNSGCGKQIDKADFVFRCNLAPVKPFIQDAGAKTNFTTMNPQIIDKRYNSLADDMDVNNMYSDIREHHGLVLVPCFAYFGSLRQCRKILDKYKLNDPQLVIGHPDHFRSIQGYWRSLGQSDRLSTGFYLMNVAIQLCDEVHLFGFWPFDEVSRGSRTEVVPYHYYDDLKKTSSHAFTKEFHLLLKLHMTGVIRIHPLQCEG